jgi:hypothetical protein
MNKSTSTIPKRASAKATSLQGKLRANKGSGSGGKTRKHRPQNKILLITLTRNQSRTGCKSLSCHEDILEHWEKSRLRALYSTPVLHTSLEVVMRIYATHFVGREIGPFNITHCVAESLPVVLCRATLLAFALFVLSLTASLVAECEKRCSSKVGPCHFRFLCELAARDFSWFLCHRRISGTY